MQRRDETVRVLHVDDEPDFAEMVATFLEREDDRFEIDSVPRASDGLARLETVEFDCIVSDYDMPAQNGIEFLETIREKYPDLPFILFTGKGSEEVASEAISAGVTDYLQKESGTDQYTILANRIQNYVERRWAHREREAMRERMQLALTYTNSIIFEVNFETGAVTRHGQLTQVFDVPPADHTTYESYLEHVVHPADRDRFREFYDEFAAADRDSGTIEYRTNPDIGRVRWIRDTVHRETTNPTHLIGLAQDVTPYKAQERKQQQIIERVTDGIVEVNADWEVTLVNEQAEALFDMDEDDLVGRTLGEIFPDAEGTRFATEYRAVMESREPTSFVDYSPGLDTAFDVEVYPNDDGGIALYFREVDSQPD